MGSLLTTSSVLTCPHGGVVSAIPAGGRVTAGGDPAVLATDTFVVAGCAFAPVVPHPCVRVSWQLTALRGSSGGSALLTTESVGLCAAADGAVQGPVLVQAAQPRAEAL